MKLADLTVTDFLNKVRSNEPVPGGGSVAALNAGLAASLTGMVANLTVGRKKYAEVEGEMNKVITRMEKAAQEFILDIDRDSEAYTGVMDAFRLPKETDEEKQTRKEAIQTATKQAALIPLSVARNAYQIMDAIFIVAKQGNQNAITDACVAMMCCRTAVVGAILNVRINLQSLDDVHFVDVISREVESLEQLAFEKENKLLLYLKNEHGL